MILTLTGRPPSEARAVRRRGLGWLWVGSEQSGQDSSRLHVVGSAVQHMLPNIANPKKAMFPLRLIFLLLLCIQPIKSTSGCDLLSQSQYGKLETSEDKHDLQICRNDENSCCSRNIEQNMYENADLKFRSQLQDKVMSLRHLVQSHVQNFKTYFFNSLNTCHTQLDIMFKRTYGPFYETNSAVFEIFFNRLRAFSSPYSDISVEKITSDMFSHLFRIVFSLLNPLTRVSDAQAKCMVESMDDISPFGDMPKKIVNHLEKVLASWRQFIGSLETANEVLRGFMNITLSKECLQNVVRMTDCSLCSNVPATIKPCGNFCRNVLKGCLAEWAELDQQWNHVVGGLAKMSQLLGNTHNLHGTFNPLPVQLSEAVMTFQEKGATITNKVLARCFNMESDIIQSQEPSYIIVRGKRSNSWMRSVVEDQENKWKILQQLMASFAEKIVTTRGWFKTLPESICSETEVSSKNSEQCWNGTDVSAYTYPVAADGISHQTSNLEYQNERRLSYSGLFVDERLKMGMLSFKIFNSLNGKNYSSYELESASPFDGENINDDEDYMDGSGDNASDELSVVNIGSNNGPNKISEKYASSSYLSKSSFIILLIICWLAMFYD